MNNQKLEKIHLESFLIHLSPDMRDDYGERKDGQRIQEIVGMHEAVTIRQAIEEGREVLAMEPFPWEWVSSTLYACVYDEEKKEWVDDDPILYHKWLTKMVDLLEEEAKRQGKLTSNSGA